MLNAVVISLDNVDTLVALKLLEYNDLVDYCVIDPYPTDKELRGLLEKIRVPIEKKILKDTETVFISARLTTVYEYLSEPENSLKLLIIEGGFLGKNVDENQLPEYAKYSSRFSPNLSADLEATLAVLECDKIKRIFMTGKNVTMGDDNTYYGAIWRHNPYLDEIAKELKFSKLNHLHAAASFMAPVIHLEKKERCPYNYIPVKVMPKENSGSDIFIEWYAERKRSSHVYGAIFY